MVFGQPRQDDLVEFLTRQLPPETVGDRLDQLRIDLTLAEVMPRARDEGSEPPSA
jgi:hypothetical protein